MIKLNAGFSRKIGETLHREALSDVPRMRVVAWATGMGHGRSKETACVLNRCRMQAISLAAASAVRPVMCVAHPL